MNSLSVRDEHHNNIVNHIILPEEKLFGPFHVKLSLVSHANQCKYGAILEKGA